MTARQIVHGGGGPWVVVACAPTFWVHHHCKSRRQAERYRCRLGCTPTHHFIMEPKEQPAPTSVRESQDRPVATASGIVTSPRLLNAARR
jgi:hypothetical protein